MKTIRTVAATLVAAGGLVLGLAGPASAHDTSDAVWAGGQAGAVAGRGGVDQNHTRVWAEDRLADNQPVRTWYQTNLGEFNYVRDGNGSASGRGSRVVSGVVTYFQVCVGPLESETCGYWQPA